MVSRPLLDRPKVNLLLAGTAVCVENKEGSDVKVTHEGLNIVFILFGFKANFYCV